MEHLKQPEPQEPQGLTFPALIDDDPYSRAQTYLLNVGVPLDARGAPRYTAAVIRLSGDVDLVQAGAGANEHFTLSSEDMQRLIALYPQALKAIGAQTKPAPDTYLHLQEC